MRHLCGNTFEWSLTHDQSKKRGRCNYAELSYFLFKFQVNGAGEAVSFSWVTDVEVEESPEVFEKVEHSIAVDGWSKEQIPII